MSKRKRKQHLDYYCSRETDFVEYWCGRVGSQYDENRTQAWKARQLKLKMSPEEFRARFCLKCIDSFGGRLLNRVP